MQRFGRILRQGIGVTALAAIMTGVAGAQPAAQAAAQAAGSTAIVATTLTPNNCGKYTAAGFTSLAAAITATPSGTILVCPGTYAETADMVVAAGGKLTIKQAITGDGMRPVVQAAATTAYGIDAENVASLTVSGLTLDTSNNTTVDGAVGMNLLNTPAVIHNVTIIGGNDSPSGYFIYSDTVARTVTITNSAVLGFIYSGVFSGGISKVVLSGSILNAADGGRVSSPGSYGVRVDNETSSVTKGPSASITKNIISTNTASGMGVWIDEASGVTVANNTLVDNAYGVEISNGGFQSASGNKITGNTIRGVTTAGVFIYDSNPAAHTLLKTTISKNVIRAQSFALVGTAPYGVRVTNTANLPAAVTATVSGNLFYDFPVLPNALYLFNDNNYATVTTSGNDHTP